MKITPLVIFLISTTLAGQDFHDLHPEVTKLKKELDHSLSDFKKVHLENEEFLLEMTDGGGELVGYFKNGQIIKIEEWVGLSNAVATRHFYFLEGELYFVEEEKNQFTFNTETGEFDYSERELVFRGRYLFIPAFDALTEGHDQLTSESVDIEKFLLSESGRLTELLRNKR